MKLHQRAPQTHLQQRLHATHTHTAIMVSSTMTMTMTIIMLLLLMLLRLMLHGDDLHDHGELTRQSKLY